MKSKIQNLPESLNTCIVERGSNFSTGEKQLLCLARALIHHNRILFLDEATSNIDFQTANLIQKTLKSKFVECTVLTVTHRWQTVLDTDKVLVLDKGNIIELSRPDELVKKKDGYFNSLLTQTIRD